MTLRSLLLITSGLSALVAVAADDPVFVGKVRNFAVSPEFYPPPNERQMKSQLRSEEAQPLPQNRFLVSGVRLETFKPSGERELSIETPGCVYDAGRKSIESTNLIKVGTADGKFSLQGEGFSWQQTNSVLVISNAVETRLDSALFAAQERTNAPAGQTITIKSQTFDYRSDNGLGRFGGGVQATGTNVSLSGQRLVFVLPFQERQMKEIRVQEQVRIHYGEVDAEGGEAVYDVARGTAEVTGNPRWRGTGHEGAADRITIDRATRVLTAEGNGRLRMAGNALNATPFQAVANTNTVPATNHFVQVTSDRYEFHTNRALFHGSVLVRDEAGGKPQGTMASDDLEVRFAGKNNFERLLAQGNVRIDQPEVSFRAGRADYAGTNGVLELTDNPKWIAGERSGTATVLRLDSRRKEMAAVGSACMHLPASEVATAQAVKPRQAGETPRKPLLEKAAIANICSDQYLVSATGARFDGSVKIDHPQLRWSSQTLQVDLPATGGRVERLTAEQDVRFELSNETQQIRGRSDRAVYSYAVTPLGTNDYLRLTGNPVLTTTNGSFRGTVILLDVGNQRLIAPEAYRIEAPANLATTNLLRLPQNRIFR